MFLYLDHFVGLARHLEGVARHLAGVAPYPLVFLRDTGVMNCRCGCYIYEHVTIKVAF